MKEKHCKWYHDEFCTNGDSPCVADYCPVVEYPELCKYRELANDSQSLANEGKEFDIEIYLRSLEEGDNITVTCDLLNAMEQAKEEIERLTEERFNLNAEIAKQKIKYEALKCGTKIVCGAREILSETIKTEIKQQAEKDTAKEIWQELYNETIRCGIPAVYCTLTPKEIKDRAKRYGVEVE